MTVNRAWDLQQPISSELDRHLQQNDYQEIFVNLGKVYLIAIEQSQEIHNQSHRTIYAEGGIGSKKGQMKQWICAKHNAPN